MTTSSETPLWAHITLKDTERLALLRDAVFEKVDAEKHDYEREELPHITIHPYFRVPEGEDETVRKILDEHDLEGTTVTFRGFDFWPDRANPLVVMLDVDVNLSEVRDDLRDTIEACGGENIGESVPPHLTLFRAGGHGDEGDWEGVSWRTDYEMDNVLIDTDEIFPWATQIDNVVVGAAIQN